MASTSAQFGFMMPLDMRVALEERAMAKDMALGAYIKMVLADHLDMAAPQARQRGTGKPVDKAAQHAKQKAQRTAKREAVKSAIEQLKQKIAAKKLAASTTSTPRTEFGAGPAISTGDAFSK